MNCSPLNVSHVAFLLKLETVGLRLLITTTIANALTAHYAKRTSKEKGSLSRLVNHFVKAMPGWESDFKKRTKHSIVFLAKTCQKKPKSTTTAKIVHRIVGIFFNTSSIFFNKISRFFRNDLEQTSL